MKTEDGTILEATTIELYDIYCREEYYKLMSFTRFVENCRLQGTKITDSDNESIRIDKQLWSIITDWSKKD